MVPKKYHIWRLATRKCLLGWWFDHSIISAINTKICTLNQMIIENISSWIVGPTRRMSLSGFSLEVRHDAKLCCTAIQPRNCVVWYIVDNCLVCFFKACVFLKKLLLLIPRHVLRRSLVSVKRRRFCANRMIWRFLSPRKTALYFISTEIRLRFADYRVVALKSLVRLRKELCKVQRAMMIILTTNNLSGSESGVRWY